MLQQGEILTFCTSPLCRNLKIQPKFLGKVPQIVFSCFLFPNIALSALLQLWGCP